METSVQSPRVVVIAPPPQKFHPGLATASLGLPCIGSFAKGEKKKGFARLGVDAGGVALAVVGSLAANKASLSHNPKSAVIALTALPLAVGAFVLNRIHGAFDAFQPTPAKPPKVKKPKA